jgi:hypothetical protein
MDTRKLKRLRDAVLGQGGRRQVEVAQDGSVQEISNHPSHIVRPRGTVTKLSARTFGRMSVTTD